MTEDEKNDLMCLNILGAHIHGRILHASNTINKINEFHDRMINKYILTSNQLVNRE